MPTRILTSLAITLGLAAGASAQTPYVPYLVKDVDPSGSAGAFPIGAAGDRLIFAAKTSPAAAYSLWATGGTSGSTSALYPSLLFEPQPSLELGDVLVGSTVTQPDGMWRTDGSAEGTARVGAMPVNSLLDPFYLQQRAARDGRGVFFGRLGGDREPWVTDGTSASRMPFPLGVGSVNTIVDAPGAVEVFRGGFAVAVENSAAGGTASVWLYEPSTHRTTQLGSPTGTARSLRAFGGRLFLNCGDLCVTDGSAGGTRVVAALPGPMSFNTPMLVLGNFVYFNVLESGVSRLWRSDGTTAGTVPLVSIAPALAGLETHSGVAVAGSVLYFAAAGPSTGLELWRTDGTAGGTFLLKDIDPGPGSGMPTGCPSFPCGTFSMAPAAGGLVFWARTAATGYELWQTDGTSAGTVPLPEIMPGPVSADGGYLFRAGNHLYFRADDGVHGRELWAIELPAGAVAIGDAFVTEGDAGTTNARFAVRLESAADRAVTVSYTTVAGTAQAGSDFVAQSGTLTFAPGAREAFVDVAVVGDATDEPDESFELAVTAVTGAPVSDGRGVAVVLDDDGAQVTVAGATVAEGDSVPVDASFPVTLTTGDEQPAPSAVTVFAQVEYLTATAADFPVVAPGGPNPLPTVTFPAGTASGTTLPLIVRVQGDTLDEPNETFSLRFDAGNDAVVPEPGTVVGVILDDDGIAAAPPIEIGHGSQIVANLAPPAGRTADEDFYVFREDLNASYEIVADAVSGDAAPLLIERVFPDGGVFQTAQAFGTGNSVSLRFFGLGPTGEHLRVRSTACGSACGTDDVYRLRMYETTLSAPRVDNVGQQATVVILQNLTDQPVSAVLALWKAAGTLATIHGLTIEPHATAVVNTATLLPQFSGSLTCAHTAPYGGLVGKLVAIDPSSGFASDTPLTARPR